MRVEELEGTLLVSGFGEEVGLLADKDSAGVEGDGLVENFLGLGELAGVLEEESVGEVGGDEVGVLGDAGLVRADGGFLVALLLLQVTEKGEREVDAVVAERDGMLNIYERLVNLLELREELSAVVVESTEGGLDLVLESCVKRLLFAVELLDGFVDEGKGLFGAL